MKVRLATATTFVCFVATLLSIGCGKAEYEARMQKRASQLKRGVPAPVADEAPAPDERSENVDEGRSVETERSRRAGASTLAAVFRTQSIGNLRQIGQALINYESQNNELPPRYLTTADREPGLSWRVALLPFLDEQALYGQFHLDEPWDSQHNRPLALRVPNIYRLPQSNAEDGRTNYLGVAGPDSVFVDGNARHSRDVRDGTSKTIFVVEVDDDRAVEWTKPDDFEWEPRDPSSGLGGLYKSRVFIAGFLDATVRTYPQTMDPDQLSGLFTIAGGERVELEP